MELARSFYTCQRHFPNSNLFSTKHFHQLIGIMDEVKVKKGASIYEEGDKANKWFYVKSGTVELSKTADDGKELTMSYALSGDFFGELKDDNRPTHALRAEAVEPCTIGAIHQEELQRLFFSDKEFAFELMNWMAYIQRSMQLRMRDLLFYGKFGALSSTLIRMINTYGFQDGPAIRVKMKLSHAQLAKMIGATRETVNRMLNQLRKDGIIEVEKNTMLIYDIEHLKNMSHCEGCPASICRL